MYKSCQWLLYLLLLVPPLLFFTNLTRNPYYFQIFLLNSLVLLFWIIILLKATKDKNIQFYTNLLDLPLLSFCAVALLSWFMTYLTTQPNFFQKLGIPEGKHIIGLNYLRSSIVSEGTKKIIFTLVNVLLVYYLSANFITEKSYTVTYHILFFSGFIAAVYGILQYFGIEPIWPKVLNPFGGRSVSTFGNPNFLSSYLVLLFPVNIFYMLNSNKKRYIYFIAAIVYFMALLCTLTRSSWVGLIVAVGVMVWLVRKEKELLLKHKNILLLMLGMFTIIFLLWPKSRVAGYNPTPVQRLVEIADIKKEVYGSVHQRLLIWLCAWDMVKEKPLLGKGWGCFELFYPYYQGKYLFLDTFRRFRTHANNAHNEILEIWSQTGFIGMGIYVWFIVIIFIYGIKLIRQFTTEKKILASALLGSIAGMLADNLLNVSMHFCVPAFLYWWNLGLLSSLDTTRKQYSLQKSYAKIFSIIAIIIFLYLIPRWYKHFMGEVNYFRGFKLSKRGDIIQAIRYLDKSFKYHRSEVNNAYELANCYARIGEKEKAIEKYYEALAANCGYDEIYFNLATVYAQKREIDKAILNYTAASYINPLSLEAYHALGQIFWSDLNKNIDNCISVYKQATSIYPENKDLWNNLGFLLVNKGDLRGAVEVYKTTLDIDPDFVMARANLRVTLEKLGIKNDPYLQYETLMSEIEDKINKKDWKNVLLLAREVLINAPKSIKARLYLANALYTVGQLKEAVQEYNIVLKIDPRNVTCRNNLGVVYLTSKQYELAKKEFETVLTIDPNNAFAKEKLEEVKKYLR